MITPDTSVVVAAFSPWHTLHDRARQALAEAPQRRLIGHVAVETIATLSRMPEGHRIAPALVLEALERTFREPWITLDAATLHATLARSARAGLTGGAFYDALIAATAVSGGLRLVSADRRARATYDAVGASVAFVA